MATTTVKFYNNAFGDDNSFREVTVPVRYEYNANDPAPFHPKATESIKYDRCYVCGRKLGKNPLWMEVINGGDLRHQDGTEAIDDAGYMGHYPIGSECAKKFAPNLLKRLGA